MKLSSEQIKYIENYIARFEIKYYEVYMEILDHLILGVEAIMEHDKTISLENAAVRAKVEGFGKMSLREIEEEKVKSINSKNRKSFNKQLKSYFDFPKSMITLGFFVVYFLLLSVLDNPQKFQAIVVVGILIIGLFQLGSFKKLRKKDGFYILKTESFFLYFNLLMAGVHINNGLVILGKDVIDFQNIYIRILMSVLFTYTLLSYFVFMKIRKSTLLELKQEYA